MQARFTKPSAKTTEMTNVGSYNQTLSFDASNVYDGNWHHVALFVSASEKKAHAYFDYQYKTSLSLPDGLNATGGALQNGVGSVVASDGTVPAFVRTDRTPRLVNGDNVTLKRGNLKALSLDKSIVKYSYNAVLSLFKKQTIEFFMKAGAHPQYAGIIRCNGAQDSADNPAWALSFSETPATAATRLRVRCAVRYSTGDLALTAINEDAPVVVGDKRWHHIALTLDGFVDDAGINKTRISIYKDYDEQPAWTKEISGELYYRSGCASVWLGASSSTTAFYNGLIDEVRITEGLVSPSNFLRFAKGGMNILIR